MTAKTFLNLCFALILAVFFFIYLTSLSLPNFYFHKSIWAGDDPEYLAMMTQTLTPGHFLVDLGDIKKHALFPMIAIPLFRLALGFTQFFPEAKILAPVFPFAFIGTVNLVLGYFIFKALFGCSQFNVFPKLMTLLYGSCFSQWIFSSSIETYAMTTLFVNLMLLYLCRHEHQPVKVRTLGLAYALCILSTLSMVVLIIPIAIFLYYEFKNVRKALLSTSKVVSLSLIAVGVVYGLYYLFSWASGAPHRGGFGLHAMARFSLQYLNKFCVYSLRSPGVVFRYFFINAVSCTMLQNNLWVLGSFYMALGIAATTSAIRIFKEGLISSNAMKSIFGFLLAYSLFHCFFAPSQAILYSLPVLLPVLVLGCWGIARIQQSAVKCLLLSAFIFIVLIGNTLVYCEIMKFDVFILKGFYRKESFHKGAKTQAGGDPQLKGLNG